MTEQKIIDVQISDFCDNTVSVTVSDKSNTEKTFYVQLENGDYRPDLGCLISEQDVSCDDFREDDFDTFDFSEIAREAEEYFKESFDEEKTGYKIGLYDVYLLTDHTNTTKIVLHNEDYCFKSYQRKYSDSITKNFFDNEESDEDFDSVQEALEFLSSFIDKVENENLSEYVVSKCLNIL